MSNNPTKLYILTDKNDTGGKGSYFRLVLSNNSQPDWGLMWTVSEENSSTEIELQLQTVLLHLIFLLFSKNLSPIAFVLSYISSPFPWHFSLMCVGMQINVSFWRIDTWRTSDILQAPPCPNPLPQFHVSGRGLNTCNVIWSHSYPYHLPFQPVSFLPFSCLKMVFILLSAPSLLSFESGFIFLSSMFSRSSHFSANGKISFICMAE